MNRAYRVITLFSVLLFFVWGVAAFAFLFNGNPTDTPAGTTITASGANNKANYSDANYNPRNEVSGNSISITVTAEYGIVAPLFEIGSKESTRGMAKAWDVQFENNGNAPMTFNLTYESSLFDGASDWSIGLYSLPDMASVPSGTQYTLGDNNSISWEVVIRPSNDPNKSPNKSSGMLFLSWNFLEDYPIPGSELFVIYTYYTGVNGKTYGGLVSSEGLNVPIVDALNISTPVVTITRESVFDAPDNYVIGTKHDPVPGAVCTIVMTVSNEGSQPADKVVIIDKVPTSMEAYKANVYEPEDNVALTGGSYESYGVDIAWSVYWTTADEGSLNRSYDSDAGWTLIDTFYNTTPGGVNDMELTIPSNATFIRFKRASSAGRTTFDPGEWTKLQWSAYIR